ncbi:MAG: ASPIC/UnbV domain-containing protein [Armatimonadetes bacterium]|nr:ASPIC/UnbV domain-containing protein [Armatimonadota bacterium]
MRQEVGLGDATAITAVTIQWPGSGAAQVVRGVRMGQFYRVREGDPVAHPWRVPHFRLPARPAPGTMPMMPGMTMR